MNPSLFVALQYLAPHHLLSRTIGLAAASKSPLITSRLIPWFAKKYQVNMEEAERENLSDYESFNDFFTRTLKPEARPLDTSEDCAMVCPVDGEVSQAGDIKDGRIFQAKGVDYTAFELLAGNESWSSHFYGGKFVTLYLSPKDYHRIHMPVAGKLTHMAYVPGRLFSVNQVTAEKVPRLFARNERVVALFETELGKIAMVLVGAMIVASIETQWAGEVAPLKRKVMTTDYGVQNISLNQGDEMGRFKLGSTVVLLSENPDIPWDTNIVAGNPVKMGQKLAINS